MDYDLAYTNSTFYIYSDINKDRIFAIQISQTQSAIQITTPPKLNTATSIKKTFQFFLHFIASTFPPFFLVS